MTPEKLVFRLRRALSCIRNTLRLQVSWLAEAAGLVIVKNHGLDIVGIVRVQCMLNSCSLALCRKLGDPLLAGFS